MTGILELFALAEMGSGIGFLVRWRSRLLASKVNYFHPPHNRKSPLDKLVRAQTGPVITRQDRLCVKVADGLTGLVRRLVMLDAFRQLMRALALPSSPIATQTGKEEAAMKKDAKGLGWRRWLYLFAVWLFIPGGTVIVLAWLLMQEVHLDKELSAYYDASFGEFMERRRQQKEAEHDVHPLGNE